MFKFTPIEKQITKIRNENAVLRQRAAKQEADLDYVAMMTDVEIPEEEEETNEE